VVKSTSGPTIFRDGICHSADLLDFARGDSSKTSRSGVSLTLKTTWIVLPP